MIYMHIFIKNKSINKIIFGKKLQKDNLRMIICKGIELKHYIIINYEYLFEKNKKLRWDKLKTSAYESIKYI